MADSSERNYIYLSDEEGKNLQLEHLDTFEFEDNEYFICLPTDIDPTDPNYGLLILRQEMGEDGELYLDIPSDEESERVYNAYDEKLYEEWDEEDE